MKTYFVRTTTVATATVYAANLREAKKLVGQLGPEGWDQSELDQTVTTTGFAVGDVVRVNDTVTVYGKVTEVREDGWLVLDEETEVDSADCVWVGRDTN